MMRSEAKDSVDGQGMLHRGRGGDVLVMSLRRRADLVAYCTYYELEDIIVELTGADRFDIGEVRAPELSRRVFKALRYLSGSRDLAWRWAPKPSAVAFDRHYELFLPIFTHPHELFALASVPNWRKSCRVAACFIAEMWEHLLPGYLLELLKDFDHVFIGVQHPVKAVAKITGRPCSYLPLAADVMQFSPYPHFPERVIDVCNIGRRSPIAHRALMSLAHAGKIFYYYDTVAASGVDGKQRTFHVQDAGEHRLLFANLLKRSRYYVANRSLVNDPAFTRGRQEISGRFYEGAAGGAVMIGEAPESEEFERQFDWKDAIVHMPFDTPDPGRLLDELDMNPQRIAAIRENNFRNAALRHDWVHRLRSVYETLGLRPTSAMHAREQHLAALAAAAWPRSVHRAAS